MDFRFERAISKEVALLLLKIFLLMKNSSVYKQGYLFLESERLNRSPILEYELR